MKRAIFLIIVFAFIPLIISAQTFFTENGKAEFTSSVPLHEFKGISENLTGMIKLKENTVDFYLDLETLDTGNSKRDRDMLLTLETEKYPFAEFFGELKSTFDTESMEEQPVTAEGTFKIHGVEREIQVTGTLQNRNDGLMVKADWVINMTDYDIVPPKLLIVKVEEEIEIYIEALLEPYEEEN